MNYIFCRQNGQLEQPTLASMYILLKSLSHIADSMNGENKKLAKNKLMTEILVRIEYLLPAANYLK